MVCLPGKVPSVAFSALKIAYWEYYRPHMAVSFASSTTMLALLRAVLLE